MKPALKTLLLWASLWLMFGPVPLLADSPVIPLETAPVDLKIGEYIEFLEDPGKNLKLASIQKRTDWRRSDTNYISFGVISSALWFRIRLENKTGAELSLLLQENYSQTDDLRFYLPAGDAGYREIQTGEKLPFRLRMVQHRSILVPVELGAGESATIYMRIICNGSTRSDLRLISWRGLYRQISYEDPYMWMYFGFLWVVFFYNLILYLSIRERAYLYYILYLLCFLVMQFILNGYAIQYLWPEAPWIAEGYLRIVTPLTGVFFLLFLRVFIGVKRYHLGLDRFILALIFVLFLGGVLGFFLSANIFWNFQLFSFVMLALLFFPFIVVLIRKKSREALYVAVAFSFFAPAVLPYVLDLLGIIPESSFSRYGILLGSAMEVSLLSLALAYRVKLTRTRQRKSEMRFQHLINNVNDVVFTLDKKLLITSLNPAAYKELGFEDSFLLGSYFPELAYEDETDVNHRTQGFVKERCITLSESGGRSSFTAFINTHFRPEPVNMRIELELIPVAGSSQILVRMSPVTEGFLMESMEDEEQTYEIENNFNEVEFLIQRLTSRLSSRLSEEDVLSLRLALREALFNAIEHGNLELDSYLISSERRDGDYEELIREHMQDPRFEKRRVRVDYSLTQNAVSYRITDEGAGFDHAATLAALAVLLELIAEGDVSSGAGGLHSMQKVFDSMEFNEQGNQVLLVKNLPPKAAG